MPIAQVTNFPIDQLPEQCLGITLLQNVLGYSFLQEIEYRPLS